DFQSIINEATALLGQTGTIGDMEGIIVDQLQILKKIFPALIAISVVITGTLNYYVTIWYINKVGFNKESYIHVKYWFLPRWVISIGIVIALLLKGNLLFVNLNMVLLFFTLIQGYAVSIFFIDKKFKSFVLKLIYTAIILFVPVLPPFLILLGLVDFWFDFRKIKYNKKED
ncbi:MAG: YybS family protein, partial [Halanaerobiales bacterium]|nr:YybS family protein [Halanaerobiales bacterium]